jgi:hypothetical protein
MDRANLRQVAFNRSDDVPAGLATLLEESSCGTQKYLSEDAFPVKGRHRQTVKTLNVASRGATLAAMKAEKVVANDHGLTVASVVNNRDEKPQ